MLNEKILKSLNGQANKELYSAYFYLGMWAYAAGRGLAGFANWFYCQWKEELLHAKKFYDYIIQEKGKVTLEEIAMPPQDFSSGKNLFEKTLAHERKVSLLIKNMVELAKKERDKATENFLQWFVNEQKEEEESPSKILDKINTLEKEKKNLGELDTELAARK